MKRSRKRWVIWSIVGTVALAALLIWSIPRIANRPPDPLFSGVPLSEHLFTIYAPAIPLVRNPGAITPAELARLRADVQKRNASRMALGDARNGFVPPQYHAGTLLGAESLPLITNWVYAPPPANWKLALARRVQRLAHFPRLTANRQVIAWSFLREYPVPIKDPTLSIFLFGLTNSDPNIRHLAGLALSRQLAAGMKVEKDPALRVLYPRSSYFDSTDFHESRYATDFPVVYGAPLPEQLRNIVDSLDPGRDLIPLYVMEFGPAASQVGAAQELASRPRYPDRAVPLLISNLSSTNRSVIENCAKALGAYRGAAQSAVGPLQKLLDHPRDRVRLAASNAIAAIRTAEKR